MISEPSTGASMFRVGSTAAIAVLILAGCTNDRHGTSAASAPTTTGSATTVATLPATTAKSVTDVPEPAWAIQGFDGKRAVIQVIAADGSGRTRVGTDIPGTDQTNPDWSPDGMMLTFGVTDDGGRDDLWTVNVDGTGAQRLFDCEGQCNYIDDAAWAPDGSSIAVCEMDSSGTDHIGSLVSIDVSTGGATTLATFEPKDFCSGARWSPDGRMIVLEIVHRDGTSLDSNVIGVTLSTLDITMTPPAVVGLTDPKLFAVTADWNHAGDLIVYSALLTPDAAAPELFTMHPDGSGLTQLTSVVSKGGAAEEPSFNQDGTAVVFVNRAAPGLVSVDIAGGTVSPAFAKSIMARHPRVRPQAGTTGTALRVVGLGDSVMETGASENASILDLFAAKLKSSGVAASLVVDNLGDPSATSDSLRSALQSDGKMRDAVAAADIVVVSVGGNDADPFATYPPGTCAFGGDSAECLAAYAPHLVANLDAIATEILALRGGKPTALRLMSPDYNPFVGWDQAPSASFGADFYAQVASAETAAGCAVAESHGGLCVDVFHLLNGPDGTADAATYLADDHAHPGRTGIEAVASLLTDLGVPELGA